MLSTKLQLIRFANQKLIVRYAGSRRAGKSGGLLYKEKTSKPSADRKLPFEPKSDSAPLPHRPEFDIAYVNYNQEAREWYSKGLLISKTTVGDNRQRPMLEVDPEATPFKSVYQDDPSTSEFTEVEAVKDPKVWYWVDRLLPPEKQLSPVFYKESADQQWPTGWSPPSKSPPKLSYFVARSRNRLLPVYKSIEPEDYAKELIWGYRRPRDAPLLPIPYPRKDPVSFKTITLVNQVDGDIRQLEEDLRGFLEKKHNKKILSAIIEGNRQIRLRGDYTDDAAKWLTEKGF